MKEKLKSVIQKITAGALALVFSVTLALPKAYAVTGVDDVSVGIMAVLVHLDSIGGSLAVQQGTALATQNAVTALATQAGVAGALGTGVTGTAALATIGGAVTAAAVGGFTIGYVGYQQLSKLAEWIRQSKLTGTAENKIYISGGDWHTLSDGKPIANSNSHPDAYTLGQIYTTAAGSAWRITTVDTGEVNENGSKLFKSTAVGVDIENKVHVYESKPYTSRYGPTDQGPYYMSYPTIASLRIQSWYNSSYATPIPYNITDNPNAWDKVFGDSSGQPVEKQEVTYVPPVTWSPPAPTLGQDVYYNPYPQMPQKPIKEIVEDVPKDIYDKKFDPAPPSILDPSVPPIMPPDVPPVVNPNPDVTAPEDVQPYIVRLGDVFPFCIPFDIYHMVTLFAAEPEAPHAKWEFSLPFTGGTYEVEWDLREWDEVAALCRKLELILFCVGLAVVTSKLIKW